MALCLIAKPRQNEANTDTISPQGIESVRSERAEGSEVVMIKQTH